MPVSRARARRPVVCAACCVLVVVAACGSTSKAGRTAVTPGPRGSDEIVATVGRAAHHDRRPAEGARPEPREPRDPDLRFEETTARRAHRAQAAGGGSRPTRHDRRGARTAGNRVEGHTRDRERHRGVRGDQPQPHPRRSSEVHGPDSARSSRASAARRHARRRRARCAGRRAWTSAWRSRPPFVPR